jgi:5-methylthioadenosine/S-adenosylhomocysteine deaminase
MSRWSISGATVITPEDIKQDTNVIVKNDKIEKVIGDNIKSLFSVDGSNGVLTPGLINAHDHLLGTYYPKVGNGPYENWLPWDNDLKSSPVYEERQQIENRDLYLLGGYRNLLSGVTTVSDHIPHFVNEPYIDIVPMKVISNYALAHAVASFALAWGDGIEVEYQKAVDNDMPFITHIAEGFDPETSRDINTLNEKGALGKHSVLIHGLAFSDEDIELIKKRGASVVWCADSNMFMFNKTANVKKLLETGVNICIGTDSPMSGGLNLLYEMRYDKLVYKQLYKNELSDELIVRMVTTNPSSAFRLKKNGSIKTGNIADLVLFYNKEKDPYGSVVSAELRDILLVIIDGKPFYGSPEYSELFDYVGIEYQEIVVDGVEKIVFGDVIGLLKRISRAVGFKKEFPFMPVQFDF